jgi:hypothetical protein
MKRYYASGSEKRKKKRERQENMKRNRRIIYYPFLKPVHRIHDASETTEETKAVAA